MSLRVLVLTASIGSGHIKAAEAVVAELKKIRPKWELVTVDFMSAEVSRTHWLLKKLYLRMLSLMPDFYDVCYKFAGSSGSSGKFSQQAFSYVVLPAMKRLLREYQPDLLLCTHPFPEGAAALLKKHHREEIPPIAVVMTDYSLHQIWIYQDVDMYFMATEAMCKGMMKRGFAADRLQVAGIPVGMDLEKLPVKTETRRQLGLEDLPTVLLMGGGLGLGGIENTLAELETLPERLQLLVIAGRNENLLQQVKIAAQDSRHVIRAWGYTGQVHELMRASDLLITKPGALTITEAFVLGLPMLLHDPIPGPETENAVYATKRGAAVWLHPGERLAPAVEELLHGDLQGMGECAKACSKPRAAAVIAEALSRLHQDWH